MHGTHAWDIGRDAKKSDPEHTGYAISYKVQAPGEQEACWGGYPCGIEYATYMKPMPERMRGMPMCQFLSRKRLLLQPMKVLQDGRA